MTLFPPTIACFSLQFLPHYLCSEDSEKGREGRRKYTYGGIHLVEVLQCLCAQCISLPYINKAVGSLPSNTKVSSLYVEGSIIVTSVKLQIFEYLFGGLLLGIENIQNSPVEVKALCRLPLGILSTAS